MSEFDEEAERERLREQYEQDQADRESTQRMSELLLKGATMTNAHCGTCGDPIFRQNDEEFCPTCQERVDIDDESADTGAESTATADRDPLTPAETPDRGRDRRDDEDPSTADPASAAASSRTASTESAETASASADGVDRVETTGGSIAESRSAIEGTLARFAAAAAETSDPRAARDHLAAAREAAETLAALDELR